MTPAIQLTHVTKRYKERHAVDDLNLHVERGEVLGFLGPNGAGKTTTIRLLTGFLRPTIGSVHLLGMHMAHAADAQRARQQLGFVPDVAGLDPGATGLRLLNELATLQRQPPVHRDLLCRALELDPYDLRRPIGALSRGTRQKINIVQGLQHRPDVLVLDEPTEGLDPLGKRALFDLLRAARDRGATIFFSSHILSEVEALCDRVALIRGGRLIAVDRIAELRRQLQRRVTLQLRDEAPIHVAAELTALPTVANLRQEDGVWRFTVGDVEPLLHVLVTLPVADIAIEPPSLEDVFLSYYRNEPQRRRDAEE
jgi:ABC-2 type transport system ATP-binding protein